MVSNWGEFCAPLRRCFSEKKDGRPVDPTVYFKIFLIGYLEGIVEDTDLAERIADSISIREFLGYGLCERPPDHSSISRVRGAFGKGDALSGLLQETVNRCVKAGLVDGKLVAVDSVLLRANTDMERLVSMKTGMTVKEHLKHCRETNQPKTVSNEEFRAPSDPDVRMAKKRGTPAGMHYKATHVTDSKSQVVLATILSLADVGECEAAIPALEQARLSLEKKDLPLGTVVADSGYDDGKFHAFVETLKATPLTNYQVTPSPKTPGFAKSDFVYDPESDTYRCPQGKLLTRNGGGERPAYLAKKSVCQKCPFKDLCVSESQRSRTIRREPGETARERNIARCHTDEGREQLKRRKIIVEPPFAHMKRNGGLSRLNCRTATRVKAKVFVAAIAWNLMKLVQATTKPDKNGSYRLFELIFIFKRPTQRIVFA